MVIAYVSEHRPTKPCLQIKHFDDPPLAALRQLDDIAQEFDPAHKVIFLSQTLHNALPDIPEPLWFRRVLQRFNEHLIDSTDLYPAILRPLMYILSNCESHNIHRLRPWFKRILEKRHEKALTQCILESMSVVFRRLNDAELGSDLKAHLVKVVSKGVEQRPAVQMLALIKHFDDPPLAALRQLDDIAQEFDPAHKVIFLSQTLHNALPDIPEPLWFRRVLQRFNEHLIDSTDLYPAILRPLMYILSNCESHNIHRLRPWFKRILEKRHEKALTQCILESMSVVFRRLNDAELEDQCLELLLFSLTGNDPIVKQVAVRSIVPIVDFIPLRFINKHLIPVFLSQIDLLVTIGHLSDRCDSATLHSLLAVASVCSALHPAIVHSKSRLVQRILTCDVSRLRDTQIISNHLLNPLVLGLALPEMSPAHFDDVMSSSRILLDITEQLRYDSDDFKAKAQGNGRLCSRRVSMSSNHLPRLLITAARPSISGDGRKMSFLSADGRLEDRGRRDSKDSRGSIQSDVSIRLGNDGSDLSDESAAADAAGHRGRRKSWLEGYMHSASLEHSTVLETRRNSIRRSGGHQSERTSKNTLACND
ncbi:Protein kinase [Aphelenchoides avenae]|nr:Protein kinase [Aphelenchus avenae]